MRQVALFLLVSVASLVPRAANAQVSIGITIGQPPPPPRVIAVPAMPAPEYVWVEGYWYPQGHHYKWHDGYWTRPPFAGAYWVDPYYHGGRYFEGYWERGPKHLKHNHDWDRDDDRDQHYEKHHKHDD